MMRNDITYFVEVDTDSDTWVVECVGMNCVDSQLAGTYYGSEALPESLKHKLSALVLLRPLQKITGVGWRSTESSFWVSIETSS
tara:strand:- start:326 stop:577 length:252 start_codon:yes stop_codon:yes gene_type:complete